MNVTPRVVAVALGRTAPDDTSPDWDQWQMWIADALMLIEARLGPAKDLDQARVDYVVREAVVAMVKRPDDATQVAVSVDDGSVSRTYRSSKGRVSILDEWWALLAPLKKKRAFSIDTLPQWSQHLPWCSLSLGANFCSCGTDIAGSPIYEVEP